MSDTTTGQVTAAAAELYEKFFVPALFGQWPRRLLDLGAVEVGQEVLDIACGTGVLARSALSRVGPTGSVTGVDSNAGMLDVARERRPGISWVPGRAEALPMVDDSYDRVFCQFGLMFFDDRDAAVAEMSRVLRPGGRVCIATWAQLADTPGYAAMVALLDEMFGAECAGALAAPFCLGTSAVLQEIVDATFDAVEISRLDGVARFGSIDAWVTTDVRAWTLDELLDDAQFDELRRQAGRRLAGFCDSSGAVSFPAPALVATGSPR